MHVTIYTSVNSGGYDVQVWLEEQSKAPIDLTGNRFSTREAGHQWADKWLDESEWKHIDRVHQL